MRHATPGTGRALPEDLTKAITRAGYYPALVCDVVESALADDHPELSSVELNPVNAWTGGVDVLGAEVVVRPAMVRKDPGRRRMT